MDTLVAAHPYETPSENLYDPGMARRVLMGIEETRKVLSARVKLAESEDAEQTVMTRHGKPVAVIVPIAWFRRAAEALNEPTDL